MSRPSAFCAMAASMLMHPSDSWVQKPCDDNLELHLDSEMNIGQAYTTDEAIPILDLRYSGPPHGRRRDA